jgi:hypothetical protein
MSPIRVALLAGLGIAALTLPVAAAPSTSGTSVTGGSDARSVTATSMQFAQRSEERGGSFKKSKKKKMKKMKKKKM